MAKPGLGSDHQRLRALLPKPLGAPCPYCEKPMWPADKLDLDHVVPRALGGAGGGVRWAHASCNRSAGGRLGNALRRRASRVRSRQW